MLGHVVGAVEGYANPREMNHQYRLGAKLLKRGEPDGRRPVDGANGAVWYRIPDAPYSVPYVPPSVTVGSMGHLGRMGRSIRAH